MALTPNFKFEFLQLTVIVVLYYGYENKRVPVFFTVKAIPKSFFLQIRGHKTVLI